MEDSRVPSGWSKRRLLDVAQLPNGQVDPRELPYAGWPLLAPNHVQSGTGRWVEVETAKAQNAISGKYMFDPGDVIYSKIRPYLRKATLATRTGLCSADMYPLRCNNEMVPGYLLATLLSEDFTAFATSVSMRTGIPKINREELAGYEVALPPLPEQRKIAAILSSVDETIEKTEAVVEQLGVVKTAMMQELLTRGLPGRHTRFKKTEIGEVPEEWEVVALSTVASVQTGIAKGKKLDGDAIEVPYLRVANVQDGFVDLSEMKTIRVEPRALDRYALLAGDVLFTEGGDADKLGRGCVWHGQIEPCLHQNHVFAVRTARDRLIPQFLSYFGGSSSGKGYFLEAAKQTTNLASINSTQLKALPVPLPSLDDQGAIVDHIDAVAARLDSERTVRRELLKTKQALMSVLLTGEVRVHAAMES